MCKYVQTSHSIGTDCGLIKTTCPEGGSSSFGGRQAASCRLGTTCTAGFHSVPLVSSSARRASQAQAAAVSSDAVGCAMWHAVPLFVIWYHFCVLTLQEGYDKKGYDRQGYSIWGYNRWVGQHN